MPTFREQAGESERGKCRKGANSGAGEEPGKYGITEARRSAVGRRQQMMLNAAEWPSAGGLLTAGCWVQSPWGWEDRGDQGGLSVEVCEDVSYSPLLLGMGTNRTIMVSTVLTHHCSFHKPPTHPRATLHFSSLSQTPTRTGNPLHHPLLSHVRFHAPALRLPCPLSRHCSGKSQL